LIPGKRSFGNSNNGSPLRRFQTTPTGGKIPIVPEGKLNCIDGLEARLDSVEDSDWSILDSYCVCTGTREAAFLHAISAAGVAHSVTKQCSGGNSPNCGCDRSMVERSSGVPPGGHGRSPGGSVMSKNFKWAGCSDNIDYGVSLSRSFVDAKDHKMSRKKGNKTSKALMNLHNNEAGRKVTFFSIELPGF